VVLLRVVSKGEERLRVELAAVEISSDALSDLISGEDVVADRVPAPAPRA
jgi:hypothetical protein